MQILPRPKLIHQHRSQDFTVGWPSILGALFPPSNAEVAIQTIFGPIKVQQVSSGMSDFRIMVWDANVLKFLMNLITALTMECL
ncbi:hypothetical protein COLO4_21245 [Corchorus olitorius]|uniref:Uncharacterized protein n=1 Tax=Corchorus olitorius TaxID=93759 RepID=A0A1R3IUQ6_9ROSI|nr:hypothetical protein COLO4_21245 [Corchorus olitorius]